MKLALAILLTSLTTPAFAKEVEYLLRDRQCFADATGKDTAAGPIPARTFNCLFAHHGAGEYISCNPSDVKNRVARPSYFYTREPIKSPSPTGTWNDVATRSQLIVDSSGDYIWTETITNGKVQVHIRCTGEAEKF